MPIGPLELILVIVIVLLLFGATRLKDLGKGAGEGIREFKTSVKTDDEPQQNREITSASTRTVVDGEVVGETSEPLSERR